MITKENFKDLLQILGFKPASQSQPHILVKNFKNTSTQQETSLKVDFKHEKIDYLPLDENFKEGEYPSKEKPSAGFIIHHKRTCNFSGNENFVCLLCVDALLSKGYESRHIIIEPAMKVGHGDTKYGDILVLNKGFENLILIENKTYGNEFDKEWNKTEKNGGQLFSYYAVNKVPFLCLLAFDFDESLKKIFYKSHIITMSDNQEHLQALNQDLKENEQKRGFDSLENRNARDYFEVWSGSYSQSYTTKGLLEEDIQAYSVGKEKYTTKDLEVVSYNEISSIYHAFATILRNNAIGNYENTFYILVDLFLCKIVDEKHNADDLQFVYKGVMHDNAFDYIDRLLNLYEIGIDELFKKKVVNVKKSEIDALFDKHKKRKNGFKADLDKLFDKQKYFNIKKFNFIEVENEEEFLLNFKVLTKITNLIQDLYISKSDNNQFLGDLFEGFLNKSIHQTEGRFFTPTPITNFIIHSLPPLKEDLKVLDFACGAGHFLTEFITHYKNAKLHGIEKNKDLSKVAKTACLLHNAKQANIIFQDSLDDVKEIFKKDFENESFDLILSNPPYSVKGFLNTLDETIIKKFDLSKEIDTKSYEKNNAIECFFIERAKQLLKENALLAIVLPVSILQKGGIYENTRELLFSHFQILSIVEMNSRTFGSTGTQTILLFAKRVSKPYAKEIINLLKEAKFNDEVLSKEYDNEEDKAFLKRYAEFMTYNYEDFKAFMSGANLSDELKNNDIFKEYFNDFHSNKAKKFKKEKLKEFEIKKLFEKSSLYTKDLDTKSYNKLFKEFKTNKEFKELEKELYFEKFLEQIKEFECEKMFSFALIKDEKVLVLKAPNDKKKDGKSNKQEIIQFLGYDWSKRKGDEGIKYISQAPQDENLKESDEDSQEEKKEKEALRNVNSIKFIKTPLYNPNDKNDKTKLCFALKSFMQNADENLNQIHSILKTLEPKTEDSYTLFIKDLKYSLDFSRAEFNKAISLNPQQIRQEIKSKFEIVKLETVGDFFMGGTPSKKKPNYWNGNIKWLTIGDYSTNQIITDTKDKITQEGLQNSSAKLIPQGAVVVSIYATIGRVGILGAEMATNQAIVSIIANKEFINKYLMYVIDFYKFQLFDNVITTSQQNVNLNILQNMKIPKPPLEIQKQIVAECEEIEKQYQTIRMNIDEYKKLIKAILIKCGICENDNNNAGGGGLVNEILNTLLEFQNTFKALSLNFKFDLNALQKDLNALPHPPQQGWEKAKLGDKSIFELKIGKRVLDSELHAQGKIPVYSANVLKPFGFINKELLENYDKESVLWGIDGDWMVGFIPKNTPFYPTDHCGVLSVKEDKGKAKIVQFALENEGAKFGFSRTLRASIERVEGLKIPLPPLNEQEKISSCIENLETQILNLNQILQESQNKKAEILQNYIF